jgi:hypothetical protein
METRARALSVEDFETFAEVLVAALRELGCPAVG